ncbi:MAG: zinc ribbon domain-containing protein [Nocardioidaceae bacterium]
MPLYDYRCTVGHRSELLVPISDSGSQSCPACGEPAVKVPSPVSIGGRASPGLAMSQMPQTWRGTHDAHPEYVAGLRRQWEGRQRLEEKYPELQGDRRPILAHEGRYHDAPLRAGDPEMQPSPAPTPRSRPRPTDGPAPGPTSGPATTG